MRRRQFLALLSLLIATRAGAQVPRIGFLLGPRSEELMSPIGALRSRLRELGYAEGKDFNFEFRSAESAFERLPALAAELVAIKVDVLVAVGTAPSLAAKRATTSIPIVMVGAGDPVQIGLVASLARPGGNVSGTSLLGPPFAVKRLELLKQAQPRVRRVAMLVNPSNPGQKLSVEAVQSAAKTLKLEVRTFNARNREEIRTAFAAMTGQDIDAVLIPNDSVFSANAMTIAEFALERRIPSIGSDEQAQVGVLMGYGSLAEVYRHSASYIVKILRGAKPA